MLMTAYIATVNFLTKLAEYLSARLHKKLKADLKACNDNRAGCNCKHADEVDEIKLKYQRERERMAKFLDESEKVRLEIADKKLEARRAATTKAADKARKRLNQLV